MWMRSQLEPEQINHLRELEQRLREALARDAVPRHLSRYYSLLCEVRVALGESPSAVS